MGGYSGNSRKTHYVQGTHQINQMFFLFGIRFPCGHYYRIPKYTAIFFRGLSEFVSMVVLLSNVIKIVISKEKDRVNLLGRTFYTVDPASNCCLTCQTSVFLLPLTLLVLSRSFLFSTHVYHRLVQRMGRTGRKRDGRVVSLMTQGKEEQVCIVQYTTCYIPGVCVCRRVCVCVCVCGCVWVGVGVGSVCVGVRGWVCMCGCAGACTYTCPYTICTDLYTHLHCVAMYRLVYTLTLCSHVQTCIHTYIV